MVFVNLGAGKKFKSGYINVDFYTEEDLEKFSSFSLVSTDCISYIKDQPAQSLKKIYSRHFFEHLDPDQLSNLLLEIVRTAVSGCELKIIVPHWSNPYYYSDPTHKTFFGLYTAAYWCSNRYFQRGLPEYCKNHNMTLSKVYLRYKSPFKLMRIGDMFINICLNSSTLVQELVEWYIAKLFPIYEVEYTILVGK